MYRFYFKYMTTINTEVYFRVKGGRFVLEEKMMRAEKWIVLYMVQLILPTARYTKNTFTLALGASC
jgi:hypothetical protein